ncbi:MAG TPA: hypothetical protein VH170_07275 [Chthoniobacterales bacterium]|jgi:hypothetical protein|nr:hypothetical protein [Chthoniobacterales bacterium]
MRASKIVTLISVLVFAASLTQNCYNVRGDPPSAGSPGVWLLFIGPIGLFYGIFEWLANPVLLAAWIFSFVGKNKIALVLGALASALIVAFLFRQTIIASEAPTYEKITRYGLGYWLWLTSAALVILSAVIGILNERKPVES